MQKRMVWVLGGVSHQGKTTDTQSEMTKREGQEAVKDRLRGQRAEFRAVCW